MKTILTLLIAAAFAIVAPVSHAATLVIQNNDSAGEGFNDPTPVSPLPGNSATTLGQQRLNAFTFAANIWGQYLDSNVNIIVRAQMDILFCDASSAVLGQAGTTTIHNNFVNAPFPNTWYSQALANSIAGTDLDPTNPDINATFNSELNGQAGCLGGIGWYLGTDQNPGSDIDFITVVTHEMGHGLGFQTFQSSGGAWFSGLVDAYGRKMVFVGNSPEDYPSMLQSARAAGNIGDPNLVWNGTQVTGSIPVLVTAGTTDGRVRLHGPNPFQSGSSLSHWSTAVTPNDIMEPFYTGANHDVTMSAILFKDIGWGLLQNVATAISFFDVRARALGVDIQAQFESDASQVTVSVYRGQDGPAQTLIYSEDIIPENGFSFTDDTVEPGQSYTYMISIREPAGDFYSSTQSVTVPVLEPDLAQNVPNPFNPTTVIDFTLPQAQHVQLIVYDAGGRVVRTLVNETRDRGTSSVVWDARDSAGARVSTGVYFYRLVAGDFTQARKMVLLK